jgi:hypothetical protein
VIFELGHANGRRKEIIWICHECLPLESLPSDFQGKFVVRYESAEDLAPTLEAEILRKMGAVIQGITEERTFREIWDFGESNCVDLVFGHIPKDERSRFASTSDPNFLRYQAIADVDTLVYLSRFLSRNFPALAQQDFMPFEFRKDIDAPLIAVGGPALNKIASRYYEGPEGCGVTTRLPIAFAQDNATEEDYIRLRDKEGNVTELRSQVSSDGVTYDVGVFARFIDRQNKVPVFVISGIRTGGVLGAAKALSDNAHGRRNCQYLGTLDRDLTEFLVILKVLCRVQDGEMIVETPTLDGDSIILLDSLT